VGNEARVFVGDLDSEEVVVRRRNRRILQEKALTAADFNLQRGATVKEDARIPRRRNKLFNGAEML
jgi:hypothetical protein